MSPDPTSLFGGGAGFPTMVVVVVALVALADRSDVWKHFDKTAVTVK